MFINDRFLKENIEKFSLTIFTCIGTPETLKYTQNDSNKNRSVD